MGPPPPKMATFGGKSEWNPYLVQFNMIASRYKWNNEHLKSMLDKGIIVPSASEWSSAPVLGKKMELLGIALILEGLIRSRKKMLFRSQT